MNTTGTSMAALITTRQLTAQQAKQAGTGLHIHYQFNPSPFGELLIASTASGVCHLVFVETQSQALAQLKTRFAGAQFSCASDSFQHDCLAFFHSSGRPPQPLRLQLVGTPFQCKVWQCLLTLAPNELVTYSAVARAIGQATAVRAVASAIGKNSLAGVVPCHRVIQQNGQLGGYRWGSERKAALINWQLAQHPALNNQLKR